MESVQTGHVITTTGLFKDFANPGNPGTQSALGRERGKEDFDSPIRDPVQTSAAGKERSEMDKSTWTR